MCGVRCGRESGREDGGGCETQKRKLHPIHFTHQAVQGGHLDDEREQVVHDRAQELVGQLAPGQMGDGLWERGREGEREGGREGREETGREREREREEWRERALENQTRAARPLPLCTRVTLSILLTFSR